MTGLPPTIRPPTEADIRRYASVYNLDLSDAEVADYTEMIADKLGVFELLGKMEPPQYPRRHTDRDPGYHPDAEEDPHNAIVTNCTVRGADSGPLKGHSIAVKDNISVAGVELTLGSKAFEGYIPSFDAEVVTRLLDAGAIVTSKTNLDEMAFSGSGELTATGPILNPRNDAYLAGGSSGGSAVAVIRGDADIALGTDQAGSIRTPAAWSGCVGLKPTYGLVPYTGSIPGGPTYDHVGPMARTVETCAKALSVIVGPDGFDHRQSNCDPGNYVERLEDGVDDLRIGVLSEGFGLEHSEAIVDESVREAATTLADLGATVRDISVPLHSDGILIWLGVATGESAALLRDNGQGYYMKGRYFTQHLQEMANIRSEKFDEFGPTVVLKVLLGEFLNEELDGFFHAKSQNLRQKLDAAYAQAFDEVDLLLMPTTPTTAFERAEDLSRKELVDRAAGKEGRTKNTMPLNMTGHPAISVPCAVTDEGLPAGMMLVGQRFDEATVLRAAHAFQSSTSLALDSVAT